MLATSAPKGLLWDSARYPDEDHSSTVLRAHYAGLRTIFQGWRVPRDPKTGEMIGGLDGVEQHYRRLSERFGYRIEPTENTLNSLGYRLMEAKKIDQAIAVLKRNVELYPESANVYDSLGEALEAAGHYDSAAQNFQKAIEMATRNNDGSLPSFRQHLERVTAEEKRAGTKNAP